MNCNDLDLHLVDYFADDLAAEREEAMLSHLESCEGCRARFREYQTQDEGLRLLLGRHAAQADSPARREAFLLDERVASARVSRSSAARVWLWAAAASLMLTLGVGGWVAYRRTVPMGDAVLARAEQLEGHVQSREGGAYQPIQAGAELRQNRRVKVAGDGYLAAQLNDGGLVEAKGGSQFSLVEFPNRLALDMNRGQVWAHLKSVPEKRFVVETAHARAWPAAAEAGQKSIFGVQETLDRTVVQVAEGRVLVDFGGVTTEVGAGESFSTRSASAPVFLPTAWSRHPQDLMRLVALAGNAPAESQPLLTADASAVVPEFASSESVTVSAAPDAAGDSATASSEASFPEVQTMTQGDSTERRDLAALLPDDTRFFVDFHDWRELVREFRSSQFSEIMQREEIQGWWRRIRGEEVMGEYIEDIGLLDALDLAELIEGEMMLAVTAQGQFLLIADCASREEEVRAFVDRVLNGDEPIDFEADGDLIEALLRRQEEGDGESLRAELRGRLLVQGGRLILSSDPELAGVTVANIVTGTETGFARSEFFNKATKDISRGRLVVAADLKSLTDAIYADATPERDRVSEFLGVRGLDYFAALPDFVGLGMDQAARIGFSGERYGAMDWLAEPAPMRGMDFFSPEIHFFASAIVRSPRQMIFDYLLLLRTEGDEAQYQETLEFFERHEAFFDAFGGEVAIGLDSPILPIPNVKIVIEVVDPSGFEQSLNVFLQDFVSQMEEQGHLVYLESSEHKGYTISTLVFDDARLGFEPSYTFVDDFFVMGPGAPFVSDSIDVYTSDRSISRDSRLMKLMPAEAEPEFSLFVYQDIARSIPDLVTTKLAPIMGVGEGGMLPDVNFLRQYRAPGIAYAYAGREHVDLYMKASGGFDFNMGMAIPLVAEWLLPRTQVGRTLGLYSDALVALEELRAGAEVFEAANGRLPESLSEIANPPGRYIDQIPADPFATVLGNTLRLAPLPTGGIALYSVGPDGLDDQGRVEYNPDSQIDGPGDVLIRLQR